MVIIINYVCSISSGKFCSLNILHMICASSQIKLEYKFNTVISWQNALYVYKAIWSILSREVIMSQMILEYDEVCMFLFNIEVFHIMTQDLPYTSGNEAKCTILYQKFRNFIWQDFSLFKNFEANLYISHTMHYKSWRFQCFISWKLVWWPIFLN